MQRMDFEEPDSEEITTAMSYSTATNSTPAPLTTTLAQTTPDQTENITAKILTSLLTTAVSTPDPTTNRTLVPESTSAPSVRPWPVKCNVSPNLEFFAASTSAEAIFVIAITVFIFFLSIRSKFSGQINIWLICSCCTQLVAVTGKAIQDLSTSPYRCLVSETTVMAAICAQSLIQVGMSVDRWRAVNITKSNGCLKPTAILGFSICAFITSLIAALLNLVAPGIGPDVKAIYPDNYVCILFEISQRGTALRVAAKISFCVSCIGVTLATTFLTVRKILDCGLRRRAVIAQDISTVCSLNVVCWLAIIVIILFNLIYTSPPCQRDLAADSLAMFLMPIALVVDAIYIRASKQLRKSLSASIKAATVR